jgi:predicted nucleotidyltransferase
LFDYMEPFELKVRECNVIGVFSKVLIDRSIKNGYNKIKTGGQIMIAKQYSVEELKKIIAPIAKKYHISRVYLFGSFARGDYNELSDVDLRIEKGELKGMFALCGFYTEVAEALQMKVDVLTTGSLDDNFLRKIAKDEVMLYAG